MHDDGERVRHIDPGDGFERTALGRDDRPIGHAANGPRDIGGGEGMAVVKVNPRSQMEYPRKRVGTVPRGSQPGLQVEVFVLSDQGVVDQCADAFGLRVGALAHVEVVR